MLNLDYEALQTAEILNSDGRTSICLKHSCPQPPLIGHREHSLSRSQGSSKIACMPIDLAATSTTAVLCVSGQVTRLVPPKPEINANPMNHAIPEKHHTEHENSDHGSERGCSNHPFHMHLLEIR